MHFSQVAQLGVIIFAAMGVYGFVAAARDGEVRRDCSALCALKPAYAARNRTAPDFELPALSGGKRRLSSYRGKSVILNFWTKNCRPCLEEMPSLAKAHLVEGGTEWREQGQDATIIHFWHFLNSIKTRKSYWEDAVAGHHAAACAHMVNQSAREVKRLVHPSAEVPVRLGNAVVPQRVVDAVWGFCVAYIAIFAIMLLILVGSGMDQVTAFSAVASGLNNLGPGLGSVVSDFTNVSDLAKWVCLSAILFGRLEIFTLLVLISPTFWRS